MSSGGASVLPIVGVMGSGKSPHEERAGALGRWLAAQGVHLLTGGGGGVMLSVSRAFAEAPDRRGRVIGVLPGRPEPPPGYPNPWVEIPIRTHLASTGTEGSEATSRNHINVLSSDVVVALPGSAGTSSEVRLALAYGRPVIAFVEARTEIPDLPDEVPASGKLDDVREFVTAHLARKES